MKGIVYDRKIKTPEDGRYDRTWHVCSTLPVPYVFCLLRNLDLLRPVSYTHLDVYKRQVEYFNGKETRDMEELVQERRFFQNTYAPTGGRMYLNDDNALRIDYARCTVEDWKNAGLLDENE